MTEGAWERRLIRCCIAGPGLAVFFGLTLPARANDGSLPPEWNLEPDPDEDVLTTEELRSRYHDLVAGPLPATYHWSLSLGLRFPYHVVGLSLDLDYFVTPWLRVAGMGAVGGTDDGQNGLFTAASMEAWVGLRLFGTHGETTVELPPRFQRTGLERPAAPLRASVPSYRALFVEAGVANGKYAHNRCIAPCADVAAERELENLRFRLWTYGAGLRFIYQRHADSRSFNGSTFRSVELFAHYFLEPFDALRGPFFDSNGTTSSGFGWGARGGFSVPLCSDWRCMQVNVTAGVSPMRWLPFWEMGLGVHGWDLPSPR